MHERSTKDLQDLFASAALNSKAISRIKIAIEAMAGTRRSNSRHPDKIATADIFTLAGDLAFTTLFERCNKANPRHTLHETPDLFRSGRASIPENIQRYHDHVDSPDVDISEDPARNEHLMIYLFPCFGPPLRAHLRLHYSSRLPNIWRYGCQDSRLLSRDIGLRIRDTRSRYLRVQCSLQLRGSSLSILTGSCISVSTRIHHFRWICFHHPLLPQ